MCAVTAALAVLRAEQQAATSGLSNEPPSSVCGSGGFIADALCGRQTCCLVLCVALLFLYTTAPSLATVPAH